MTHRTLNAPKILIASNNPHKVREISGLLKPFHIAVVSAMDFDIPEPEETGSTYLENSQLKARYYVEKTGLPSLADDSGININVLGGQPGIYSARWGGENHDFSVARKRIQREIGESTDRSAYFACVLSLAWPDGHIESFEGRVNGTIVKENKGLDGFGYDSIFLPSGETRTFAEMEPHEKHSISHRALAFEQLITECLVAA